MPPAACVFAAGCVSDYQAARARSQPSTTTEPRDPNFLGYTVTIGRKCKRGEYGVDVINGIDYLWCENGELTDGSARARREREKREERAAARQVKLELDGCTKPGKNGYPPGKASGAVVNNSGRTADVWIDVFFETADGVRVADALANVRDLGPGKSATWETSVWGTSGRATNCQVRLGDIYID